MAKLIAMVDDLDYSETGTRVEATVSRRLSYAGREVEIDLTTEHDDELAGFLARYFAAGSAPPGRGGAAARSRAGAGSGVTMRPRSAAERAAIRSWATAHGLSYKSSGGSTYYGRELLEKWDVHKAETGWHE
jgi:hypothetical protein